MPRAKKKADHEPKGSDSPTDPGDIIHQPDGTKPVRPGGKKTPAGPRPKPPKRRAEDLPHQADGTKPVRPSKLKGKGKRTPTHPDVGKTVWMTCRGSRPCGGKQASITMKAATPGGGWSVRYKCQNCSTAFVITT